MNEIDSLMKRARRYLDSAAVLLKVGDYESTVSRAYYAMFYAAEAALLTKNLTYSSHRGVISAFGEHLVKTGVFTREMGRELNRAFEKRAVGDYGYTFVIPEEEAREILSQSQFFVSTVQSYLTKSQFL